ncbi:hypothetical protein KY335_03240 [Candidatus Woesearchaeota archaeon]|nr:hypothetical protein [Candidatus Woesearchaeota archaeon]MBW3014231.1 hypothetical protein [Candidatus Woesearchaeota archaeon]
MARRLSRRDAEKKEKKVREKPKYFEGILQIRNPNEKIMNFVLNEFEKSTHYFSRIEQVRGGYDLYSSSNKFSRKVGQKLYAEFGGELKESAQLFTQNKLTSKEVFRLNVMYRAPDYMPGDILSDGKNVFVVTSMKKNKIIGIDLMSRKKINVDQKAEVEKLIPEKTTISRVKPSAEALDPETYQSIEIENPIRGLRLGQEVDIVKVQGHLYMISI